MKTYHIKPKQVFNRLTCIKFHHIGRHSRSYFIFRCSCGKEKIILGSLVSSGNTKSCGCLSLEVKKARRIANNHSEITAIILGYKRHAMDRGFKWMLTRKDVENIIYKNCNYCGTKPNNIKKIKNSIGEGLVYSGIDRVNSNKNYIVKNCVPCCKICNYAKSNMSLSEFKYWARKLGEKAMADQWG